MQASTERILTTHTGSLPRSPALQTLLREQDERRLGDPGALEAALRDAVADVVRRQVDCGLDIVSDGEQGRAMYAAYVKDRLTGFDGERRLRQERRNLGDGDFPDFVVPHQTSAMIPQPACTGPVAWKDPESIHRDIARLRAAARPGTTLFMTSASPGVVAHFLPNEHYPTREAYLEALADAMRQEYRAILDAGIVLQVDSPDLAMTRVSEFAHLSLAEFKRVVALHVDVLNHALAGLPPERMRLHLCWGNYEGPHHHDVPIREILDEVLRARPAGLSFEGANPRHAHEWKVWRDVKLPDGKVLIPGVIDTTTTFVEHPELVAERIERYAEVVGRARVIAGTDCGFGTSAWGRKVPASIVWAKLRSLVEGAQLASASVRA
jgi:5-methyltetrahydropteroyltriglutamate--homocysteine methyltransferase